MLNLRLRSGFLLNAGERSRQGMVFGSENGRPEC